jgi:Tfp pilus assembly protein PilN
MKAVNLIPAEQRGGASVGAGRSEGAVYAVLGLLAGLALFAFLYGQADHQISSSKVRVATLEAQARQAQAQASELAPYTSFIALREQRVQEVSELVDSRFDWAHSFHELGRVLPRGATVSTLTGTIGSSTATAAAPAVAAPASSTASAGAATSVTSATPPGSVPAFTLSGCATSQSEVALTLDRLRLIDGVREVALQSSTKGGGAGGSGAGGSGGCSAKDPVFTVQVAFDPLPATPTAGTATAATTAATSTSAAQPTTSIGGAR